MSKAGQAGINLSAAPEIPLGIQLGGTVTNPVVKVEVSSESHQFYTGKTKIVDTAGRVEKFSKKFGGTYSFQKTAAPAAAKK